MLLTVYTNMINWFEEHQLPCLFKSLFHFDCPGCGLQRSLLALLRGDVVESAKLYPAVFPVLLLFAYAAFYLVKRNRYGLRNIKFLFMTAAAVICIQYIYKTINHLT